jgi:glutaconate CoA-transferase, subunit A
VAEILSLKDAIARHVRDGQSLALEGFTHLIPFSAGHEILRQGRRDLTLIRMTPDLIYDQMVGMGAVAKIVFSYAGNPGAGLLHRVRDAVENAWPRSIALEEHSHSAMANAYAAGAAGLPLAILRGYLGSDLARVTPTIAHVICPFSGERLAAVPALRPDVTIIHAQKADRMGNVLIDGIIGIQKEAVLAARCAIVTVEEIVPDLRKAVGFTPNSTILPEWAIAAVCLVPGGARPSYASGYYVRDNDAYLAWNTISVDRQKFLEWMDANVMQSTSVAGAVA